MHEYKKLKVWQESVSLVKDIYLITNEFPRQERYGLVSQINRAAVSIPSNIAEGAGRSTNGEFKNFLSTASGSSFELETQLLIAKDLNYFGDQELTQLRNKIVRIQKMIYNLLKSLTIKV